MDTNDYVLLLSDALKRRETIVFGARCSLRYSGRAESHLDIGDRLFVIKSDGCILVHQPQGTSPINYMKSGAVHSVLIENSRAVLKSNDGKESLTANIERFHFMNSHNLNDVETIRIAGTEDDMRDMLYDNPHMIEEGFIPASVEEQTKYGFVDVFGTDKSGIPVVVECKRYCADLSAVTQLRRYVEKMMLSKGVPKVRGILAAPKITDNARKMLEDWGFSFIAIKPPSYLEEHTKKQSTLDGF